jgi:hypothetical protein
MTRTVVEETFEHVVKVAGERLRALGFARRGPVLRIMGQGTCGVVQFQRSVTNTRDRLLFTVNVGVVCADLLDTGPAGLKKVRVWEAHVRERIGTLLPEHFDKWWEVTAATNPDALAQGISDLIVEVAVPYIQRYLRIDAIIALWESGRSPGLTDRQRINHLAALKAKRRGSGG